MKTEKDLFIQIWDKDLNEWIAEPQRRYTDNIKDWAEW